MFILYLIEGHAIKRQSTAGSSSRKGRPQKPRPDFPLFPHLSRKWAKTIRGKTYYFGSWDDPEGALREYLAVRDDLYAGRTPSNDGGPGVADLCNAFLRSKRIKLDADQLSPRTFVDYERCCRTLVNEFGPDRPVKSIGPQEFEKLYARLVGRHAVSTLGREVTMVRSVFKYGFESDLLEKPVKFGPIFKLPTKQDRRKWKARSEQSSGKRLFSASEIHRLLDVADPQLKAMILLGCNGGLGNTDVANLPISALDLRAGRIDYPRPKTGVGRRIPLWPETVEALQTVIANRRDAADPVDADCVFLTRCGQRWVRFGLNETRKLGKRRVKGVHANPLSHRFNNLTVSAIRVVGIYGEPGGYVISSGTRRRFRFAVGAACCCGGYGLENRDPERETASRQSSCGPSVPSAPACIFFPAGFLASGTTRPSFGEEGIYGLGRCLTICGS